MKRLTHWCAALISALLCSSTWAAGYTATPVYLFDAGSTDTTGSSDTWKTLTAGGNGDISTSLTEDNTKSNDFYVTTEGEGLHVFSSVMSNTADDATTLRFPSSESCAFNGLDGTTYTSVLTEMTKSLGLKDTQVPESVVVDGMQGWNQGATTTATIHFPDAAAGKLYVMYFVFNTTSGWTGTNFALVDAANYGAFTRLDYMNDPTATSYTEAAKTASISVAEGKALVVRLAYFTPDANNQVKFKVSSKGGIGAIAIAEVPPTTLIAAGATTKELTEDLNAVTGLVTVSDTDTTNDPDSLKITGSSNITAPFTAINVDTDVSGMTGVANLGSVAIPDGKTLTVNGTTEYTRAATTGTIKISGGTATAPIVVDAGGKTVNAYIGKMAIAANSYLRMHSADNNKIYNVTGEGRSSHLYLTSPDGWGVSNNENSKFDNLTLEIPATYVNDDTNNTGDDGFWLTGGKTTETVHFITSKLVTFENDNYTYDFASIAGSGTLQGQGRDIKIHDGGDAEYSGNYRGAGSSLTKLGTGTQILSHLNEYTGGTFIEEGTLKIKGDGTLGSAAVSIKEGATLEVEVAENATKTLSNVIQGLTVDGTTTYGTIKKTGAGTLTLTAANLANFTGTFTLAAGTLRIPAGKEGATVIPEGATLELVLSSTDLLLGYDASAVTGSGTFRFVNESGTEVTEGVDGKVYTAPVNTWAPTAAGEYSWADLTWSTGSAPETDDAIRVNLGNNETSVAVTLKLPATDVTLAGVNVVGNGTLTIDGSAGGKLVVTGELLCNANVTGDFEKLSAGSIRIEAEKTLTLASAIADVDNGNTIKDHLGTHASVLPPLTGNGTLVKTGTGILTLQDTACEPLIDVQAGVLHVAAANYDAFENAFNISVAKDAWLRFTAWQVRFGPEDLSAKILLKGGSNMVSANGGNVCAAITVDATDETPAKIYGASWQETTFPGTITGKGTLEFASGQGFGPNAGLCQSNIKITGVISDGLDGKLKIRTTDTDGTEVTLAADNTYTGGTDIAENATVKITGANVLPSSGAVTGEGTLHVAFAGLPNKRIGFTDAANWTGLVKCTSNLTFKDEGNWLASLGNASSYIELAGTCTGYLKQAGTCDANLILSGSLTLSNGYSDNGGYTFTGALSGSGTLATSGNIDDVIRFTGDVSAFAGTVTVAGTHVVAFDDEEDATYDYTDDNSAMGTIQIAEGKSVTVATGKTWSAANGFGGKGQVILKKPAVLTYHSTWTGKTTFAPTSDFETALTLTVADGSTLELAGKTATGGEAKVVGDTSTITVATGGTLELSSGYAFASIDGEGTTEIPLGATFTIGADGSKADGARGNIATHLDVAGELNVRFFSGNPTTTAGAIDSYEITPKSVAVSGVIQKDKTYGDMSTLLVSDLAGSGTISLATTFAAGAVLDASSATAEKCLEISGTVETPESGTVTLTLPTNVAAGTNVLKASGLDAADFSATNLASDKLLTVTSTALAVVAKPSLPADTEADASTVQAIVDAAAELGATDVSSIAAADGAELEGAELFTHVVNVADATATVSYDFGVERMTVKDGYVVFLARVDNGKTGDDDPKAAFVSGVTLQVGTESAGVFSPIDGAEQDKYTPESIWSDCAGKPGLKVIAVPLSKFVQAEGASSTTHQLKIRATK